MRGRRLARVSRDQSWLAGPFEQSGAKVPRLLCTRKGGALFSAGGGIHAGWCLDHGARSNPYRLAGSAVLSDPLLGLLVYFGLIPAVHDDACEFVDDDARGGDIRVWMDELVAAYIGHAVLCVGSRIDASPEGVDVGHTGIEKRVVGLSGATHETAPGFFCANNVESPVMDGGVLRCDMEEDFPFVNAHGRRPGTGR